MADLLFKKGSYAEFKSKILDQNAATEGALYFTENEGSLYLGIADGKVKRIQGTLHQYDTLTDFAEGITPPYSTDVVYFIADRNALVRWDGSQWIQLNATAKDVSDRFTTIEGLIATNTTNIGELQTQVGTNTAAIAANAKAITDLDAALSEDIEDLDKRVTKNTEDIATKAAQSDFNTLKGRVDEAETAISENTTAIGQNAEAIATKASQADLTALTDRVAQNETDIEGLKEAVGTKASQSDFDTLKGRVDEAENAISENTAAIDKNAKAIEKNAADIETINTTKASQEDLNSLSGTVSNISNALNTKANQSDLQTVQGDVSELQTSVAELQESKVDVVEGKGLSTNDFTDALLEKLNGIDDNATHIEVDSELNATSTNPVENQAITAKLGEIDSLLEEHGTNIENLANNLENYVLKETYEEDMADINKAIDDINDLLGGNSGTSVNERLTALETDNTQNKKDIAQNASDISELSNATSDLTTRMEAAEGAIESAAGRLDTAESRLNGLDTKTDTTNTAVTNLTTRVETNEGKIATLISDANEIKNTLSTKADQATVEQLSKDLKAEIDADILAANAMTYKGGVASDVELTAKSPAIGDTYVVTSAFGDYQPGDLLIAVSTDESEVDGVIPADKLEWDHVATGYSDVHDPKLVVENNQIILRDFADNDLGVAVISSASNNITVNTVNDNVITLGLQWDTF